MEERRRPTTQMWLDDLAVVAASGVAATPRAWLLATLATLLTIGPWGLPAGIALQVSCALLAGALLRRWRRRAMFSAAAMWALPAAALCAQGVLTAAGGDGALGVPFAVLAGCLLAVVGIAREESLRPPIDTLLLGAGVIAVIAWKQSATPFEGGPHDLATGALFSLGVAAITLRASGWQRAEAGDLPQRSTPARSTSWIWWGLVPAVLVSVPTPGGWQWTLSIGAAHLLTLFAARVARYVVWDVDEPVVSAARQRIAAAAQRSPASTVTLIAAIAWVVLDGRLALFESARVTLGGHYPWMFDPIDDVSVALVAMAIAAHGPARTLRGLLPAVLLALVLPTARMLVEVAQYLAAGSLPQEYLWEIVRPIAALSAMIAVLPLLVARIVPRRPRELGAVDPALVVLLFAIRPVLAALDPAQSPYGLDLGFAPAGGPIEVPWFAAVFLVLFLRLATTPVTGRAIAAGALVAALISVLPEFTTSDGETTWEWGTLVAHVVSWQIAAAGVCAARLIAPADSVEG